MCTKLRELERSLASVAVDFDPALLSAGQAEGVMERAARMEHICATLKALAAARVAETELWRMGGDKTPAHMLGWRTGEAVSKAQQQLDNATRLAKHPKTDAAARKGKLSPDQQAAITDAAEADPRAEDDLLHMADRGASLQELRDEAARRKAQAQDPEEAHRRIHAERHARSWTGPDGAWNFGARGTADAGATFMGALRARADALFKKARAEGRHEPAEAYLFDALMSLAADDTRTDAKAAASGSRGTKVLVRVDLEALFRGHPTAGEVCEIAGFGPVPVSVVKELLAQGDTFLAAVITKGVAVVGVAHLGRSHTAAQRSALQWLYPVCAVEGCSALAREIDHRHDWTKTHRTLFDDSDPYCRHHHDLKTYEGWGLVEGSGKRAFVSPDDPRHPNHAPKGAERERPPPAAA
ncbi:MAG TPA: hypothetical protein VG076_05330 [Acidimicrobiales bacterium]|nr:hypothetical protein [Acidimicrobiales bacterium]